MPPDLWARFNLLVTLIAAAASIYLFVTGHFILGGFAGMAGGWAFYDWIKRRE